MHEITREVSSALRRAERRLGIFIPPTERPDILSEATCKALERVDKLASAKHVRQATLHAAQDAIREWIAYRMEYRQRADAWWAGNADVEPDYSFLARLPVAYRGVAECLAHGQTEREAADNLGISRHHVRRQIEGLREIFNRPNR